MRHRSFRLICLWLLVGVGCAFTVAHGWPAVRRWQVERAIARFEGGPSQTRADRLLRLLTKEVATYEQGKRVLTLLLQPRVTTRQAYPESETAMVSVAIPFHLEIPNGRIEITRTVYRDGQHRFAWPPRTTSTLSTSPELLAPCPWAETSGLHRSEVQYQCRFTKSRGHSSFWSRFRNRLLRFLLTRPVGVPPAHFEKMYDCRFTLPVTVRIAEASEAEKLERVSNPQLDEAMRTAFIASPVKTHSVYWTSSGRRHGIKSTELACGPLPIAVAFALTLRLPDGRELPQGDARDSQRIRLRADTSGRFVIQTGPFGMEKPGEYTGTLVLTPDLNHAYEDPEIKVIWNGTLEFPISFTIFNQPNSP